MNFGELLCEDIVPYPFIRVVPYPLIRVVPYPIRDSNPQPQDYSTLEVLRSIQLSQSGTGFYFTTTAGFEPARQFANRLVIYRLRPLGQVVFC